MAWGGRTLVEAHPGAYIRLPNLYDSSQRFTPIGSSIEADIDGERYIIDVILCSSKLTSIVLTCIQEGPTSPLMAADDIRIRALLNRMTMDNFDSTSDRFVDWANKSEKETDGRTLIQVIRLVYEKAIDTEPLSEMYARLCRKMMEIISPKIQDGSKDQEGKPFAGARLFRRYLINRCQEDFERCWLQKETSAAAALTKATEDEAAARANTASGEEGVEGELHSDEYYAAQKAKWRGLGLIRFMGELFKLQMLTALDA